jgi:hypothetical protein
MIEDLDPEILEKLAAAAHQVWMDPKLRAGWKYAPVTDKAKKEHHCLVPYDDLMEMDKQTDRDMVQGIPEILAIAGYKIVPI